MAKDRTLAEVLKKINQMKEEVDPFRKRYYEFKKAHGYRAEWSITTLQEIRKRLLE